MGACEALPLHSDSRHELRELLCVDLSSDSEREIVQFAQEFAGLGSALLFDEGERQGLTGAAWDR